MYPNITQAEADAWKQEIRRLSVYFLHIDKNFNDLGNIEGDNIISFSLDTYCGEGGRPTFGSVNSGSFSATFVNLETPISVGDFLRPYVGIWMEEKEDYSYIDLAQYTVGIVSKTNNAVSVTCTSTIIGMSDSKYEPKVTYPTSLFNCLNDITADFGGVPQTEASGFTWETTIPHAPTGSIREAFRQVCLYLGAVYNWGIDPKLREYGSNAAQGYSYDAASGRYSGIAVFTADNYERLTTMGNGMQTFNAIKCGDYSYADSGTYDGDTGTLEVDNELVKSTSDFTFMRSQMIPFSWHGFRLEMQGMPFIEAGDNIVVYDVNEEAHIFTVVDSSLSFNGGLRSTFYAAIIGENAFTSSGLSETYITSNLGGGGTAAAAYIVESGTSGNWNYEKYSNGRFKAFKKGGGSTTVTVSSNGVYRSATKTQPTPDIGINEITYCNVTIFNGLANTWAALTGVEPGLITFYVVSMSQITTSRAYTAYYEIEGTWS